MSYTLPPTSAPFFQGIDFSTTRPIAPEFVSIVSDADRGAARGDPSRLAALVKFDSGAVFWDAKLAVDADGVHGTTLDPASGQNDTSWHFHDGSPLDSRVHPFY